MTALHKQIFIINDSNDTGDKLFVDCIQSILDQQSRLFPTVINYSIMDKVKEVAALVGCDFKDNEKNNRFIADLKKITTEYNNMSFNSLLPKVNYFKHSLAQILFLHIHDTEDLKSAKEKFKARTIYVGDNVGSENFTYDFVINCVPDIELENRAKEFLKCNGF